VLRSLNITCSCPGFEQCEEEKCVYQLIVPFSKIAEELFRQFKQAKLVIAERSMQNKFKLVLKIKKTNARENKRKVGVNDMIYLQRSRSYCPSTGRECGRRVLSDRRNLAEYNKELILNVNVCAHLCCGKKHYKKRTIKKVNCSCRFSNTRMSVKCKTCSVIILHRICY
jgi:hypothetical protein